MDGLKIFNTEVIPVYLTDKGEKVVYGRELHKKLEMKRDYTHWVEDMIAYGFQEGIDYQEFWEKESDVIFGIAPFKSPQQASALGYFKNHLLQADMAKHIAMFQRTPQGMEIRQKLIDLEKKLQTDSAAAISFREQVECVGVVADILKANEASKLLMIGQLYKSYDLPSNFLPNYELNGSRELKPATDLLKRFEIGMSAKSFNALLVVHGYLEERTRPSTISKDGKKIYKALSTKGLKYGENAVSPYNQKEVQPLYYVDTFQELYRLVTEQES